MTALSSIYPDLYLFLDHQNLKKTLKAFKKETGLIAPDEADAVAPTKLVELVLSARPSKDKHQREAKKKRKTIQGHAENGCGDTSVTAEVNGTPAALPSAETDEALKEEIGNFLRSKRQRSKSEELPHTNKKPKMSSEAADAPAVPLPRRSSTSAASSSDGEPLKRLNIRRSLKSITDTRLLDQSYASKGGDTFAAKAAEELGRVRGKDFRREMHKKKRASWKGLGPIEDKINSIQFDSD